MVFCHLNTFILSLILISFTPVSFASDCPEDLDRTSPNLELSAVTLLKKDIDSFIMQPVCEHFEHIKTDEELINNLKTLVKNQSHKISGLKTRHDVGEALNQCTPSSNDSKGLVISFAGTGAYNPQTHSLMAQLIQCPQFQKLPDKLKKHTYHKIMKLLKKEKSKYTNWSGLDQGPLGLFLNDSKVNTTTRNFQFASFASEESELLGAPHDLSLTKFKNLPQEVRNSKASNPRGIQLAHDCTKKYFAEAKRRGITPKLIVLTHSSGGRSAVKYLEGLKKISPDLEADLVVTIDPVKEAHHAIEEVVSQIPKNTGKKLLNRVPLVKIPTKPLRVWSRDQPKSLYMTSNSKRWINFYQQQDSKGIDMPIKFGIYGSPIDRATENHFMTNPLGASAHGKITYDKETLGIIKKEIEWLER